MDGTQDRILSTELQTRFEVADDGTEMHVIALSARGDYYAPASEAYGDWGVWDHACVACNRPIRVIAPVDSGLPYGVTCKACLMAKRT